MKSSNFLIAGVTLLALVANTVESKSAYALETEVISTISMRPDLGDMELKVSLFDKEGRLISTGKEHKLSQIDGKGKIKGKVRFLKDNVKDVKNSNQIGSCSIELLNTVKKSLQHEIGMYVYV